LVKHIKTVGNIAFKADACHHRGMTSGGFAVRWHGFAVRRHVDLCLVASALCP
jgi:hypothetical protein